jgi:transposase-like protein
VSQAEPENLAEAMARFADPDRCFGPAVGLRWPEGKITCPRCGSDRQSFIATRKLWFCKGCKKQFTLKVGTIFEDSPLGMEKWMAAVWLMVNSNSRISAGELASELGISLKSALFVVRRLRSAMNSKKFVKHFCASDFESP